MAERDQLTGQKVVILGFARQGMALAQWLTSIGAHPLISDINPAEEFEDEIAELDDVQVEYALGGHPKSILENAALLCVSGGVPLEIPIIQEARRRGIPLSNDAQLFLERCPCHVIGITGSAGKTTTTTLVGKILEAAGMLPWVGGNIGNPLISDLPYIQSDDIAVMELSSFQLELMSNSPHIAAVLNITPNHLDRHGDMQSYINAKARIIENQQAGDIVILGRDDRNAAALRNRARYDVSYFSAKTSVDVGAWLSGDTVMCRPKFLDAAEEVCTVDEIPLRGKHNVLNVLAACAITGVAGANHEAMRNAILGFKPVEHRLEVVRTWNGITFINDSIATAPERVLAALHAIDEPLVLMLGGKDKDLPWDDLISRAVQQARVIIAFGAAGPMIHEKAAQARATLARPLPLELDASFEEAFATAVRLAQPGDTVLLSPGGTSFDAYKNFALRGKHFKQLVNAL